MHRILLRSAIVLVCLCVATSAFAQTLGRVVVIPYGTGNSEAFLTAAESFESALSARRSGLISLHDARDRFTVRSRPPLGASDSDVDVLAREARAAIEHVAFGRSQAAQRSVREVLARAERALESLNRETSTARQVLDACLALVRNSLQRDDRREALTQAMACRRLVPDVGPNENLHPASVIGVLAEADDQLRRMRIGRISVNSLPHDSCAVYLNGRHLGTTPFTLERAAAGSYRVQVECNDEPGRVHIVELGDNPVELTVDTDFDTTLRSDPRLHLIYDSPRPDRTRLTHHAELVGKAVRADDVVLVGLIGDHAEVYRVSVRQARIVASVNVPWSASSGFERSRVDAALDMLAEGRFDTPAVSEEPAPAAVAPVSAAGVVPLSSAPQPRQEPHRASERVRRVAGLSLAGAGGAAFVLGVAFEWRSQIVDDRAARLAAGSPRLAAENARYDLASRLRWVGVGGGVLAASSVPLLVERRSTVPWWSWTAGAAGVALIGVGAWQVAIANECQLASQAGACLTRRASEGRGGLLLGASAALLALPLSHLFGRRGPQLSWRVEPRQVGLTARFQL